MSVNFNIVTGNSGQVCRRLVINDIDSDNYVINYSTIYKVLSAYIANSKRLRSCHYKSQRGIVGSNRKIRRQKGLGRSRQGSSKQVHMRGGAVKFGFSGDKYRDYIRRYRAYKHINVKESRKCLLDIIMNRYINGCIHLVDNLYGCVKSKDAISVIKNILNGDLPSGGVVVVYSCSRSQIVGFGNIKNVCIFNVSSFNAYKCIKRKKLIMDENAFAAIIARSTQYKLVCSDVLAS